MIRTIAKRLGILRAYAFVILLMPFIALRIGIIFINATVSGLFQRACWLRELRKNGRAIPAAILMSNASGGTLIVDRPGFNFKASHCWWTNENVDEIAPVSMPTDDERMDRCIETNDTTPHEFDLWCWRRYISPRTGSATLITPPHHGEAMAFKIREHMPSLSYVTSWSAMAAMHTDNGDATELGDESKSR